MKRRTIKKGNIRLKYRQKAFVEITISLLAKINRKKPRKKIKIGIIYRLIAFKFQSASPLYTPYKLNKNAIPIKKSAIEFFIDTVRAKPHKQINITCTIQ
ncbi:hypothetical protein [Anaerosinus sp.]